MEKGGKGIGDRVELKFSHFVDCGLMHSICYGSSRVCDSSF